MKNTLLLFLLISAFTSQGQVTDIDGNSYDTVRIGTQTWMADNLNVSRFRNGDTIPEAKTEEEWEDAGDNGRPVWCYYDNDSANGSKYGKLYNCYAVSDSRGLAPEGWHVPSDDEWDSLVYIQIIKPEMEWLRNHPGCATKNESIFVGYPGGFRSINGDFYGIGTSGGCWSSTEFNTYMEVLSGYFLGDLSNSNAMKNYSSKANGLSVRCVKD